MKVSRWLIALGLTLAGCKSSSTPQACEDVDFIFDSEACLEALTDTCRAHTTATDCWGAAPMKVAVAGDYVYCAWTNVATVGDGQSCEIAETFGRCEAALPAPSDGPGDACIDGTVSDGGHYTAFVDDLELVDAFVSAPDGTIYDSLLWWTGSSAAICGEGVVAPVPTPDAPDWCSCAAAACLATSD